MGVVLLAWGVLFGPSLAAHVRNSLDPLTFADDARQQIWPLFRFSDPGFPSNDYIASYFLRAIEPAGYTILFGALAHGIDPVTTSKVAPYLLLGAVLALAGVAAARLGGRAAAVACGALCLASPAILEELAGGLPRAFGFPVMALAVLALVVGQPLGLAAAVLLAAAFYPSVALAPALALALWLFVLPQASRGRAAGWSLRRRSLLLVATAGASLAIVAPQMRAARAYGPLIGPSNIERYPEAGPRGRLSKEDRPPHPALPVALADEVDETFRSDGRPFVQSWRDWVRAGGPVRRKSILGSMVALTLAGMARQAVRLAASRRLLLLVLAAPVSYAIARALTPYLLIPQRQLACSIPLLLFVLFPAASFELARGVRGNIGRWMAPALAVLIPAVVLLLLVGRVDERDGLTVRVPADDGLYRFLAGLPPASCIAGWPRGRLDNVPYLSRRPVLLSEETYIVYHAGYVDEMRRRAAAVVDALFAADLEPLRELRDGFGVTHLVVDLQQLGSLPPRSFEPLEWLAKHAYAAGRQRGFVIPRLLAATAVFRQGDVAVLDLSRLRGAAATP